MAKKGKVDLYDIGYKSKGGWGIDPHKEPKRPEFSYKDGKKTIEYL